MSNKPFYCVITEDEAREILNFLQNHEPFYPEKQSIIEKLDNRLEEISKIRNKKNGT